MWQCVSDHRVYLTKVGEMTAKHLSSTMMYSRYEVFNHLEGLHLFNHQMLPNSSCIDWKLWSASY